MCSSGISVILGIPKEYAVKQPFLFVFACALSFVLIVPADAQEVQCLGCYASEITLNSYCQTYNGPWPDCQTVCIGWDCSCKRGTYGGRCRLGTDGIWRGFRVQDVFYIPVDRPFHSAYRVTRARMTQRPA